MRILFIDNYDSFTHNVVEMLRQLNGLEICVVKNDALETLDLTNFDKLIISPGPDLPLAANGLMAFLGQHLGQVPTLGICLGHQAIAQFYGGTLLQYEDPKHGEQCTIACQNESVLFRHLPNHFTVGLYHSWYVDSVNVPTCLRVTATNEAGIIMAMEHKTLPIFSVQFHPESYMSEHGKQILQNFMSL